MGHTPRVARLCAAVALLAAASTPSASSAPTYVLRAEHHLAPGIIWQTVTAPDPQLSIQQAKVVAGSQARLVPVLSNDRVFENAPSRRTERTTAMCARAGGIACVNADFAFCPSCGEPLGGFVVDSKLLRSPHPAHEQVSLVDGRLVTDKLAITTRLVAITKPDPDPIDPLAPPPEPVEVELVIDEVNRAVADGIVLYTPAWAATTQTPDGTHEARFGGSVPVLNAKAPSRLRKVGGFNNAVPADGFVLAASGNARDRLDQFLAEETSGAALELRISSNIKATLSIGGHPILLRDGVRLSQNMGDGKTTSRHPRTLIGWNRGDDVWVVAIDGRRAGHSVGATLAEAADYLQHLGATDAVNFDGGGSTTFTTALPCADGSAPCIRNRPSDGNERYVSSAFAIVSTAPVPPPPPPPTASGPVAAAAPGPAIPADPVIAPTTSVAPEPVVASEPVESSPIDPPRTRLLPVRPAVPTLPAPEEHPPRSVPAGAAAMLIVGVVVAQLRLAQPLVKRVLGGPPR